MEKSYSISDSQRIAKMNRKIEFLKKINTTLNSYATYYHDYSDFFSSHQEIYLKIVEITKNTRHSFSDARKHVEKLLASYGDAASLLESLLLMAGFPKSRMDKLGNDNIKAAMLYLEFTGTKRTRYSRESDRIEVTNTFRHLQYKTQVMINSASDDQRTRLLHSIEVQNIARTLSVQLGANWELAQAIAIGHDVGHAPFGHAGEEALDKYLDQHFFGRFTHSIQSVKVLDDIEIHPMLLKYGLRGIGLSQPVLEGILKHDTDIFLEGITNPGFLLQYNCRDLMTKKGFREGTTIEMGSMECQIVFWADKIAYLGHDWDEFISSQLIEKMLHRLNAFVANLFEKEKGLLGQKNLTLEEEKIIKVVSLLRKINKNGLNELDNPQADSSKIISELQKVPAILENLKETECVHFSRYQYRLLHDYFDTAIAWIALTGSTPIKYKECNDIIYQIYNFFSDTTSRVIIPSLNDAVIKKTSESLHTLFSELSSDNNIDEGSHSLFLASHSDEKWKRNALLELNGKTVADFKANERKDMIAKLKSTFQRSLVVSMDVEEIERIATIRKFITRYYIGSTTVRHMTNKGQKIINKLLKHYLNHPDMLPYENRLLHEKLLEKDDPAFDRTLVEYCLHKLSMLASGREKEKIVVQEYANKHKQSVLSHSQEVWKHFLKSMSDLHKEINMIKNQPKETLSKGFMRYLTRISTPSYRRAVITARVVTDYICSLTDRMAVKKYDEIESSKTIWSTEYSE